jgi:hypothetical protein
MFFLQLTGIQLRKNTSCKQFKHLSRLRDLLFFSTRLWTQSLQLEPFHQPPFVCVCVSDRYFRDRVSRTICPGWLGTLILLISASWVVTVTSVSHLRLARSLFLSGQETIVIWIQNVLISADCGEVVQVHKQRWSERGLSRCPSNRFSISFTERPSLPLAPAGTLPSLHQIMFTKLLLHASHGIRS